MLCGSKLNLLVLSSLLKMSDYIHIYFLDCVFFSSDFVFCDSFCCVISELPDLNMMMVAICLSSFFVTLSSHVLIFCFTFRDCSSTVVYAKAVELFLLLKNGVYTTFL